MSDESIRVISANDMHVITTQFMNAATEIHIAMCLFDDEHRGQGHLNNALHAILVGAEQCRQLHGSAKQRIMKPNDEGQI